MKILSKNKSAYSLVTSVKEITIEPLYADDQTLQRTIHIVTKYGETLDLVLYADERQQLDIQVPLEELDNPDTEDWLQPKEELSPEEKAWLNEPYE